MKMKLLISLFLLCTINIFGQSEIEVTLSGMIFKPPVKELILAQIYLSPEGKKLYKDYHKFPIDNHVIIIINIHLCTSTFVYTVVVFKFVTVLYCRCIYMFK